MRDRPVAERPTPYNTQHSQQTDIPAPAGFEPTIPASESQQTYALDRAAIGKGGFFFKILVYTGERLRCSMFENVVLELHIKATNCEERGT